jgi:phage terminase small subunit
MMGAQVSLQLEPRQERFCQEYVATLKPRAAAVRAGYSPRHADIAGRALLKRWHIQQRVAELQAQRAVRTQVTSDRIVHELAKIAFANMADFVRVNEDGTAVPDLTALTPDQMAAIGEIVEQESIVDTKHGQSRTVNRKVKLLDKKGALVALGQHQGLFIERHEHTGANGAPLIPELTPREAARRIAYALTLGLTQQPVAAEPGAAGD